MNQEDSEQNEVDGMKKGLIPQVKEQLVICKNKEQTDGQARVTLDEKEILHPGTLTPRAERQSARMSKITNDGLTRSGTLCFIAVPIWQHWASKG